MLSLADQPDSKLYFRTVRPPFTKCYARTVCVHANCEYKDREQARNTNGREKICHRLEPFLPPAPVGRQKSTVF
jgi:hypothetical protein